MPEGHAGSQRFQKSIDFFTVRATDHRSSLSRLQRAAYSRIPLLEQERCRHSTSILNFGPEILCFFFLIFHKNTTYKMQPYTYVIDVVCSNLDIVSQLFLLNAKLQPGQCREDCWEFLKYFFLLYLSCIYLSIFLG